VEERQVMCVHGLHQRHFELPVQLARDRDRWALSVVEVRVLVVLAKDCRRTCMGRTRHRLLARVMEVGRVVEVVSIVLALVELMVVEVVEGLEVWHLVAEEAVRLVLRLEVVAEVHRQGPEVLELETLAAEVPYQKACERWAGALVASFQSEAVVLASCLYSMRPTMASCLEVRRRRGLAEVVRQESAALEGLLEVSVPTLVVA
jgi:hypothetical protein